MNFIQDREEILTACSLFWDESNKKQHQGQWWSQEGNDQSDGEKNRHRRSPFGWGRNQWMESFEIITEKESLGVSCCIYNARWFPESRIVRDITTYTGLNMKHWVLDHRDTYVQGIWCHDRSRLSAVNDLNWTSREYRLLHRFGTFDWVPAIVKNCPDRGLCMSRGVGTSLWRTSD